jgi:NAD(P)-dependent dehydrogenase (short-subunit alcohol dehydrogenase family)
MVPSMQTKEGTMNTTRAPVAVVTGISRGLGRALAARLAGEGWQVVGDGRDPAALARALAAMPRGRVTAIPGDVTDAAHRRELVAEAVRLGGVDLLVNNASELGPSPLPALAATPLDALARVLEVNVVAPLALVQEALPALVARGGRIVDVTSDAAVEPYPGWGAYGASKAALDQLTAILAAEHPELRVYAADPGDMRTEMHQAAFPGEDIGDRPPPEASLPGLMRLVLGDLPSGRYRVAALPVAAA